MSNRNRMAKGFTLVEILIVVVILGILAAIVIPQFTSASESARASSLTSQLQTIRSQLELYQVQHNGVYPTDLDPANASATPWDQMTGKTKQDGTVDAAAGKFGPYLQQAPTNAFTGGSAVAADNSADWEYDASTHQVKAVIPTAQYATAIGDLGLSTNDVVQGP